jgi:hypothetical protein
MDNKVDKIWYVCWPSTRLLRDVLEPMLLINKSVAAVMLTPKTLQIQLVDRFLTSVFQRTFYNGQDYQLHSEDPFLDKQGGISSSSNSIITPTTNDEMVVEMVVDIGAVDDVLAGLTPATMNLLSLGNFQKVMMTKKVEDVVGDDDATAGANDDDDDEAEDDPDEDDDKKTKKKPKKTTSSSSSSSTNSSSASSSVNFLPTNRDDKAVWKFTKSGQSRSSAPSLEVKVRYAVTQPNINPKNHLFPTFASFSPMKLQQQQQPQQQQQQQQQLMLPPATVTYAAVGYVQSHQAWPLSLINVDECSNLVVYKTTEWEKIPIVGMGILFTPTLEFTSTYPPRFYRFDPNGTWMKPVAGAKVSLRCAADLQDDFMNLAPFSSVCQVTINDNSLQLLAKSKNNQKAHRLYYDHPENRDSNNNHSSSNNTPVSAQGKKPTKTKKDTATATAATAAATVPTSSLRTMNNNNNNNTQARYLVEHIAKSSNATQCHFSLRAFRIMHKLVGASSRIELIAHHHNQQHHNQKDEKLARAKHIQHDKHDNPFLCVMYQGSLAQERQVAIIMSLRLPPSSSSSSSHRK